MNIENRNFRYAYLKQIRKDKARKLFYEGTEIYILPKQINPFSYHNYLHKIKHSLGSIDFDVLCEFERKDRLNNKNGNLYYYYLDLENPREIPDIFYKG
jgi:hypothetical protein